MGPEEEATRTDGQGQEGQCHGSMPLSSTFQGLESTGLVSRMTLCAWEDSHLGTSVPGRGRGEQRGSYSVDLGIQSV